MPQRWRSTTSCASENRRERAARLLELLESPRRRTHRDLVEYAVAANASRRPSTHGRNAHRVVRIVADGTGAGQELLDAFGKTYKEAKVESRADSRTASRRALPRASDICGASAGAYAVRRRVQDTKSPLRLIDLWGD